jgi:hypothetical protein
MFTVKETVSVSWKQPTVSALLYPAFLNKFALFRHFNSGVNGATGFTKLVEPIPNKKVSKYRQDCKRGLTKAFDQG